MNPNKSSMIAPSSLLCITFFLLFSSATCFNITKILNTYPDFSNFNSYLTQTHLAEEINKRETITVLAVPNSAIGQISGKSNGEIQKIMSLHVVLDYYDVSKLEKLSKKSALLTTLFQSTGQALGQQGFINVTDLSSGEVAFGSAVKGSSLNANLVKSIAAQPYNISVLQISAAIIPEGLSAGNTKSPPPPSVAPVTAPKKSPTSSPSKAPSPSDDSSAPTAADAPTSAADSSLSSPPLPVDGPAADAPDAASAHAPAQKGASTRVSSGLFGAVFMVVVSSLVAL